MVHSDSVEFKVNDCPVGRGTSTGRMGSEPPREHEQATIYSEYIFASLSA